MNNEHDALEVGARYVRLLGAVERAYAIGDDEDVAMLLSGVDPVDVRMVADLLSAMAELHNKIWAGTTGERPDGKSDVPHRQSLALVSEDAPSALPPTGPESFSVKVPPPCE